MDYYLDEVSVSDNEFDKYFKKIKVLGSGAFGTVIHATYLSMNIEVAVKIISKQKQSKAVLSKVIQEVGVLKKLKHKNIVNSLDFIDTRNAYFIVMEYIRGGTLGDFIRKRNSEKNFITEEETAVIMKNLLEAFHYIHSFEIVHRDIKPENILLGNTNDLNTVKLADFGLSSLYFEDAEEYEACGTLIFMAPEQILRKYHSKSVDIWSLGIVFYMLLNQGNHPLFTKNMAREIYIAKLENPKWTFNVKVSLMAEHLFYKLVKLSPLQRYKASEALKHPFVTRKSEDDIPKTFLDRVNQEICKEKMKGLIGMLVYLVHASEKKVELNESYIERIEVVSKKKKEKIVRRRQSCLKTDIFEIESPVKKAKNTTDAYKEKKFDLSEIKVQIVEDIRDTKAEVQRNNKKKTTAAINVNISKLLKEQNAVNIKSESFKTRKSHGKINITGNIFRISELTDSAKKSPIKLKSSKNLVQVKISLDSDENENGKTLSNYDSKVNLPVIGVKKYVDNGKMEKFLNSKKIITSLDKISKSEMKLPSLTKRESFEHKTKNINFEKRLNSVQKEQVVLKLKKKLSKSQQGTQYAE